MNCARDMFVYGGIQMCTCAFIMYTHVYWEVLIDFVHVMCAHTQQRSESSNPAPSAAGMSRVLHNLDQLDDDLVDVDDDDEDDSIFRRATAAATSRPPGRHSAAVRIYACDY